jgi:uncharacterized SAM-binding protein YcdF (DUF218 family)
LSALISFVFTTDAVVLLLVVTALWLAWRPGSRPARRTLFAAALFYGVVSTFGVSYAAGRLLVRGFEPLKRSDVPAGRAAVVVLGSGSVTVRDWDGREYSTVDYSAAARVLEASRVYQLVDPAVVVASGGKVHPSDTDAATGVTMHDALVRLGIPAGRLVLESRSRNTHEEATVVAAMLGSGDLAADHIILVTSETHMRRSLGAFAAAGIRAIPAIARLDLTDLKTLDWVLPSDQGLWYSSLVVHEVIGLVYYSARGWYVGIDR